MTADEIRSQFRAFVGEERFRGFIFSTVNSLGTDFVPLCSHEVWRSFREECPAAPIQPEGIRGMLLWCHVHERPLLIDQLSNPTLDAATLATITHSSRTSEWYEAAERSFPHGHGGLDVVCPECVAAHLKWLAAHPRWNEP
ncbi:MAG: hypothetical protein JW818_08570 [Pirellulales bacterium]|nr:hypothetical protein [Pirellulales bacterium]